MKKTVLAINNSFLQIGKFVLCLCSLFVASKGLSQIAWTSAGASTAWYTATNWTPNTAAGTWLTTDVAQFNNTGTATTAGINMNTSLLSIGGIEVTNARTRVLTIGNSSTLATGFLTLNGTTINSVNNVILRNASGNLLTLQDNETGTGKIMNIALANTTDNIITIDGTGGIDISSVISGAGKKLTLSGAGTGTLNLSGANTYDGLTTVSANTLQLSKTGGGTLPSTNDVLINGSGNLRISSNQTIYNLTLESGAILTVDNGVTLTINGTFNHNGGTIALSGTGNIVYGVNATLSYGASTGQTTTDKEFPATSGPNHLTINNASDVTLHASRTMGGTITLTTGNLILGANNITASSTAGGTNTSHVYTNSTGKLIISAIGAGFKLFPIGATATSVTPLAISNGNNFDYGARVELGLSSYPIFNPANAVNRTWIVQASSTPGVPVNVNFFYSAGDGGAGFNYTATVDHGVCTCAWNLNQTGIAPAGSYQVPTTVTSFLGGVDLPMVLGNSGSILSTPRSVDLTVQKQSSKAILNWTYNNVTAIREVAIERSVNGRNFDKLATVASLITTYTDDNLLPGTNYYRIKITDVNGKIAYSAIAAIINATDGFDIVALLPNIVHTDMQVSIAAAQKTKLDMAITDVMGRPVSKLQFTASAGSNMFDVNVSKLSAGIYYLTAATANGEIKTMRFVKQ